MPRTLGQEGIEAIVLRTVGEQPTLWESILPAELLVLSVELARVDTLLDDPAFFAPFTGVLRCPDWAAVDPRWRPICG
jgi:hypothetical protein